MILVITLKKIEWYEKEKTTKMLDIAYHFQGKKIVPGSVEPENYSYKEWRLLIEPAFVEGN